MTSLIVRPWKPDRMTQRTAARSTWSRRMASFGRQPGHAPIVCRGQRHTKWTFCLTGEPGGCILDTNRTYSRFEGATHVRSGRTTARRSPPALPWGLTALLAAMLSLFCLARRHRRPQGTS